MNKIEIDNNQLEVIKKALEFYVRIGIGQFERLKEHPTFDKILKEKYNGDYSQINQEKDFIDSQLIQPRNILIDDFSFTHLSGSLGIFNEKVDDSCRTAADIFDVIQKGQGIRESVFYYLDENRNLKVIINK